MYYQKLTTIQGQIHEQKVSGCSIPPNSFIFINFPKTLTQFHKLNLQLLQKKINQLFN